MKKKPLTYKSAGVDIDEADRFIGKIKPLIKKTTRAEVLGNIGAFSGFFKPSIKKMKEPILVGATDGVGTKLLVANAVGKHDTIGIDLVAMCVNDVITCGAEPLFFLDYFATGKLDVEKATDVVKGITTGCIQAGCALIGGETAELPGMYSGEDYDLAGFCVGIIDKQNIIDGSKISEGDMLLGIASSGIHSNGYSLARKAFTDDELKSTIGKTLLKPTHIYVKPVLDIVKKADVRGIVHVTGGGFYENIPRVLPKGLSAKIAKDSWPVPRIFNTIQKNGSIAEKEMFRTFNMGIGMILVLPLDTAHIANEILLKHKLHSWIIGEVVKDKRGVTIQ